VGDRERPGVETLDSSPIHRIGERRPRNGYRGVSGSVVGLAMWVPRRAAVLAMLPGMRPRAPRRNALVGLVYLVVALLLLIASRSHLVQVVP
jgi:hypothetical protein